MGDTIDGKILMTTSLDQFRVEPKHVQAPLEDFIPENPNLEVTIAPLQAVFEPAHKEDPVELIRENLQAAHPNLAPPVCDTCAVLAEFYLKAISDENRIMAQELMTSLISTLMNKYNYFGSRRDF